MTPAEILVLLDEAFEKWAALVGLDTAASSWTIQRDGRGSWEMKEQAEWLQEARRLDDTGVTCFMLFKALVERYIEQETVTALDLIRGLSTEQQERLDALRAMREFLERPTIQEHVSAFIERVREATAHYDVDHEDLESWLSSDYWMAVLRRDALRSLEKLEAHQFCWGTPAEHEPMYGLEVLEFWNIPSLVRSMQSVGHGGGSTVHVCLIRDPAGALHSFFILAVVNGETLTVLTDRDRQAHPGAKDMSRRPDRQLEHRSHRHWFPYELVGLEVSADERKVFAKARSALVPINAQAAPLLPFSKLHPASAIWLSLLFDVIKGRYFKSNHRIPALSYTAEMIRTPELIASAGSALVTSGRYQPLVAPDLTLEDVTTEAVVDQWVSTPTRANQWMLDRYAHLVPQEALNVVGDIELDALPGRQARLQIIAEEGTFGEWDIRSGRVPGYPEHVKTRGERALFDVALRERGIKKLDPVSFGTAEDMHRDRKWTARANLCRVVQRLAEEEYAETLSSMLYREPDRYARPKYSGWIAERIYRNLDWIVEMVVRGEWLVSSHHWWELSNGTFEMRHTRHREPRMVNLVRWGLGAHQNWPTDSCYSEVRAILGRRLQHPAVGLSDYTGSSGRYRCVVDGATATYHATLAPSDPATIANMLGVTLEELPWQLQVWVHRQPDCKGNPLLSRLDPADWMLRNPWAGHAWGGGFGSSNQGLDLTLGISLSKRTVNRVRKELGLPRFDWKARNPPEPY